MTLAFCCLLASEPFMLVAASMAKHSAELLSSSLHECVMERVVTVMGWEGMPE